MKRLKTILQVNAISSGFTGFLLIILSKAIASIFGVAMTAPFIEAGIFLLLFALFVYRVSKKVPANVKAIRLVIALDIAWVLASVAAIGMLYSTITIMGTLLIAAIAVWVGGMAYLQNSALKTGNTSAKALAIPDTVGPTRI